MNKQNFILPHIYILLTFMKTMMSLLCRVSQICVAKHIHIHMFHTLPAKPQ